MTWTTSTYIATSASTKQIAKATFLRRVHEAGGFDAYKAARYETIKNVRLLARDRGVPKEVASYLLEFWASRTLYSHGAERDSFMEELRAYNDEFAEEASGEDAFGSMMYY